MLLTCCFRENKADKKTRTRPDGGSICTDEPLKSQPTFKAAAAHEPNNQQQQHHHHHHRISTYSQSSEVNVEVHLLGRQDSRDSNSVIRAPHRDGKDRLERNSRAPPKKEAKRLLKQQSQDSFKAPEAPVLSASIPFIDQSPSKEPAQSQNGKGKSPFSALDEGNICLLQDFMYYMCTKSVED